MDREQLKAEVLTTDSTEFYHQYLLGNEVWYFKHHLKDLNYSQTYDSLKKYITFKLGIHFNNVAIVGSGKIGFSLNPKKQFRNFHGESDIDIALVSQRFFYEFWGAYLDMYKETRWINNYNSVTSSLFRQFITLEGLDNQSEAFLAWQKKSDDFYKDLQTVFNFGAHGVKYRIFESWDAVQRYYVRNIEELQRKNIKGA